MNIFGAVTFGSLIKTFLPGMVWLVAVVILEVDVEQCRGKDSYLWGLLTNKDQVAAVLILAFPLAILVGLLSNIVVFMGLNDLLVRNPVKNKQNDLFRLFEKLSEKLREKCWLAVGLNDAALKVSFDKWTDIELIVL